MPASAEIYNAFAVKPKSALEYQQDYAAADDARLGRELNLLKVQSARQGAADDQGLRNYLGSGADLSTPDGQMGLYKAAPTKAGDILKSQAEISAARAKTDASKASTANSTYDLQKKKLDYGISSLVAASTPDAARAAAAQGLNTGAWDQAQADRYLASIPQDPQAYQQWRQQTLLSSLTAKDQMEQQWKAKDFGLKQDQFGEAVRHNRVGEGTAAGQLGVAQGNLSLRQQEVAQGKTPSGYRAGPNGSLEFIPGGPADPAAAKKAAPTEWQGKNALFGARAQQANKILADFQAGGTEQPGLIKRFAQGVGSAVPFAGDGIGNAMGTATNFTQSDGQQGVEQAQRDFINAVLRLESGAAIGASEFDNAKKQYFPQMGDSKAVINQKKANRELAVRGLLNNAGTAAIPSTNDVPTPAAESGAVKPFAADKEARYQAWKKTNGQ